MLQFTDSFFKQVYQDRCNQWLCLERSFGVWCHSFGMVDRLSTGEPYGL